MVEFYRDEEKVAVEQANVERARAFSRLGGMLLRAPMRLAELGVEDFRRYRRPHNHI